MHSLRLFFEENTNEGWSSVLFPPPSFFFFFNFSFFLFTLRLPLGQTWSFFSHNKPINFHPASDTHIHTHTQKGQNYIMSTSYVDFTSVTISRSNNTIIAGRKSYKAERTEKCDYNVKNTYCTHMTRATNVILSQIRTLVLYCQQYACQYARISNPKIKIHPYR